MTPPPTRSARSKRLLHSKWTAVAPRDREKHFVVTRVLEDDGRGASSLSVELQAVISKSLRVVPGLELEDPEVWRQGWS